MNLSQLEVLVAIVDTGSLTDAGEAVGLTQSAVSYSLSRLEAELGVTLVERGRSGVVVTRIGEEVLQHARSILNQLEIIRQKTARERGLSVGKLRFGCVPTIPARLLTGILRDFQHTYPEIELVLFEGRANELIEWLNTGIIDIGTVIRPEGYAASQLFVHTAIRALVSTRHPLASTRDITLEQLIHEPLIGPQAEYTMLQQMLSLRGVPVPRLQFGVSAQSTIFAMVRENMGVALMLAILLDHQQDGIVELPLRPSPYVDIYLASHLQSPAIEAFLTRAAIWARTHGFLSDHT